MMDIDDFNMYYSGSYVTTTNNNLALVDSCNDEGVVQWCLIRPGLGDYYDECLIEDVKDCLNLRGFEIKPFVYNDLLYLPSYSTVRGYKDGLNDRRVDFKLAGKEDHWSDYVPFSRLVPAMFNQVVTPLEEALDSLILGDVKAAVIKDSIGLKARYKEETGREKTGNLIKVAYITGKSPTTSITTVNNYIKLKFAMFNDEVYEVTLSGDPATLCIVPHLGMEDRSTLDVIKGWCRELGIMNRWVNHRDSLALPPALKFIADCIPKLEEYNSEIQEESKEVLDTIEIYRSGQKICDIDDPIDEFFSGLPKLTQKIKEIKDAYKKVSRDRA
jgi:hypothetical protein